MDKPIMGDEQLDDAKEYIAELEADKQELLDGMERMDAENQRFREAMKLSIEFLHSCEGAMALRELQTALAGCDN